MLFVLMPAHRALIWSVLGAFLLLPVKTSFELPMVPPLDKTTIPNLSILLCCFLFVREKWLGALKDPTVITLSTIFILSPFLTTISNPEPLIYSDRFIQPLVMYDALAQATANAIVLVPFIAAYGLINSHQRRRDVIMIIVIAALAYSVLMLIEVRLSPQLHKMVYGFFPHDFIQQIRGDGFRPAVFLGHGLLVSVFCALAVIAASAQWRQARGQQRTLAGLIVAYFAVVLLLCKSMGAVILTIIFAPILAFLRAKRIAMMCAVTCIILLFYPALRGTGLVPTTIMTELAGFYSADRESSLTFRLVNEDQLLQKAATKPLFGWGGWGRNRIYSLDNGRDLSVTDGAWIIVIGMWGWVGYVAMFGLLCLGQVRLVLRRRALDSTSVASAALSVLLTVNLLDSIPNASIQPVTWLLTGTLIAASTRPGARTRPLGGYSEREQLQAH